MQNKFAQFLCGKFRNSKQFFLSKIFKFKTCFSLIRYFFKLSVISVQTNGADVGVAAVVLLEVGTSWTQLMCTRFHLNLYYNISKNEH